MEFLTFATIAPPAGASRAQIDGLVAAEGRRAAELAATGALVRAWRPPQAPGEWKNVCLWSARDKADVTSILDSLPLRPWMTVEILKLAPHPNDPGLA